MRWVPTASTNGFAPKFNDSGTCITYGFCLTHVADLRTGEEYEIVAPVGRETRLAHIGWLDDDRLVAATIDRDQAVYVFPFSAVRGLAVPQPDGRRLITLPASYNIGLSPVAATFSFGDAGHGAWAIDYATAETPIYWNGVPFVPDAPLPGGRGYLYGVRVDGEHLVTSNHEDLTLHYHGRTLVRTLPALGGSHVNVEGDVGLGYYGPSYIAPWGQPLQDCTLTPYRAESAPFPIRVAGDLWLWSATSDDAQRLSPTVFGRRLGETLPICLDDFEATGVVVAWTGTQFVIAGHTAVGHLQVRWVSPDAPRRPLVPVPPPSEPPPTGAIMIRAFEHTCWLAPFYSHSEQYGVTPTAQHVGNAIVVVEREGDPAVLRRELAAYLPLGFPLIVQGDVQALPPAAVNQTVAFWVPGATLTALRPRVEAALAQAWKVPVIAYLDSDAWPATRPGWLAERVWPSVQAYRGRDETLEAFDARITAVLARVRGYDRPIGLTPRFDDADQAGAEWTLEEVLACMPLYEKWIRQIQPAVIMPFADRRGHGISHHPELWQWARAFQYAIPAGRPNRFDHRASPDTASAKLALLRNKLGQSRSLVTLEPWLRADLDAGMARYYGDAPDPPDPPDPTPQLPTKEEGRAVVRQYWETHHEPPFTVEGAFNVAKRVAWHYRAQGGGLVKAPGPPAENVVLWHGQWFRAGRISFSGQTVKILTDVPTTNGVGWSVDDYEPELFAPAMDPES